MKFRPSFTLILLASLLAAILGLVRVPSAHAQTTITVSTCDESHLDAAITQANSDNAGDTITFSCSGDIKLSSTLTIAGSMTLDGSGQSVTLDGANSVQVLSVNSGVSFKLNALTVAHGSAGFEGGGLVNNYGTVSISNSTFANNSAGFGGGLFNHCCDTVSISNSTFAYNSAPGGGGGGINNEGPLSISNSTFANNSAGFEGGGLFNNGGTESISNSTFANNSATYGGGLYSLGSVSIGGSIVANNTGGNCVGVSSNGYNLESGSDCGFTGTGDLQNTDPKLDPNGLQNNGGPTQTIALQQGSPAIDWVASGCPSTDQRGNARPDDSSESACDIGAYEESNYAEPEDRDLGLTNVPANITTNATSSQGAVVTWPSPTVVDEDSPLPSVNCTPASGSTFSIGTTTVTCTVSDSDDTNSPVSQSFTVTVNDTDLGLTNLPTNMTVNATSPQGATVTYTPPTAVDEDSPLPAVSCTPASGSTFPIGTTTVTCTAADSDDTPSSVSQTFTVTVKGAAAQISDLITEVKSYNLSSGLATSLIQKLNAVQTYLANGDTADACSTLVAFLNEVQAQSGKGLTTGEAQQLTTDATRIQAVIGC